MSEFKGTLGNWYIQHHGRNFWIKSDINPVVHYGTDIMCEDYGEHNGYPREQRLADAQLIVTAKSLLDFLTELIEDDAICGEYRYKAEDLINKATTIVEAKPIIDKSNRTNSILNDLQI